MRREDVLDRLTELQQQLLEWKYVNTHPALSYSVLPVFPVMSINL